MQQIHIEFLLDLSYLKFVRKPILQETFLFVIIQYATFYSLLFLKTQTDLNYRVYSINFVTNILIHYLGQLTILLINKGNIWWVCLKKKSNNLGSNTKTNNNCINICTHTQSISGDKYILHKNTFYTIIKKNPGSYDVDQVACLLHY